MRILILIIFLSCNPLLSQKDSCDNAIPLIDTLIMNTGYNYKAGTVYNTGEKEEYWILVGCPDASIKVPTQSFCIPQSPYWINPQPNSQWLSAYDTIQSGFTNEAPKIPFTFEKYFCVPALIDSIKIELHVVADNEAMIYLDTIFLGKVTNYSSTPDNFYSNFKISPGKHKIKIELRNYASTGPVNPMGLNLIGKIKGHYRYKGIKLELNDTVAIAGTENFKLPIRLIKEYGVLDKPLSFTTNLTFDASSFFPYDNSINPIITSNTIINRARTLTLKFDSLNFAKSDTLSYHISGEILLADSNKTNFTLSNILCTDTSIIFKKQDGILEIKACAFDLSHVKIFMPPDFSIQPNPASDNISITFSNGINQSVHIYNSLGSEIKRYNENELSNKNSININIEEFPTGLYYSIMNSGINKITKSFVVIR
jgi:hypothetical protein